MNHEPAPMTDADSQFLFGDSKREWEKLGRSDILPHGFKRALKDSGAAEVLAQMNVDVDDFPDDGIPIGFTPEWAEGVAGPGQAATIDLVSLLTRQFAEAKDDDERYEKATDRWRKVPDRVHGYIPGDAGSFRWTMMASQIMKPLDYENTSTIEVERRTVAAIGSSYAYLGTPFFIPAQRVLDVVTATPPSRSQRADIHLPKRYIMMFHDGVPLPLIAGTDDDIDAYEADNRVMRDDSLLIGAVLAANDDLTLDVKLAFMIVAAPGDGVTGYGWRPIPIPMDLSSPAADVLWNYAALLAWEDWGIPERMPEMRGVKHGSRGYYRALARSSRAEKGAYHGVRVLNYRPPTLKDLREAEEAGAEPRRELKYRHERRSYWKPRMRVGIRDEHGRLVGRVTGPDAIEGVTFVRKGKLIPRSIVREDLPERPKELKVYRVPTTIQRSDSS